MSHVNVVVVSYSILYAYKLLVYKLFLKES